MTMTISQIIIIFIIFTIIWIATQVIWKIIEAKMQTAIIVKQIDAIYLKISKIALQSLRDVKELKEVLKKY